jgi:uncharacterized protein
MRRFIAGAVCPACQGMDKLFLREEAEQRICECVACGHREVLDRRSPAPPEETVVRVLDRSPD